MCTCVNKCVPVCVCVYMKRSDVNVSYFRLLSTLDFDTGSLSDLGVHCSSRLISQWAPGIYLSLPHSPQTRTTLLEIHHTAFAARVLVLFQMSWVWFPELTQELTTVCNSNSMESHAFSWLLQAPGMRVVGRHTWRQKLTYRKQFFKVSNLRKYCSSLEV